jgi:hypothetical protein
MTPDSGGQVPGLRRRKQLIPTPTAPSGSLCSTGADDTITVINTLTGALDYQRARRPTRIGQTDQLPSRMAFCRFPPAAGLTGTNVPTTAGPVYAEYNAVTSQLVVANYDGGTVSVIDVALDKYGNDSAAFGTTFTVQGGQQSGQRDRSWPTSPNGSRAYAANQADETVSVVNLSSATRWKSHSARHRPSRAPWSPPRVRRSDGKVYVASPDSPNLTITNAFGTDVGTRWIRTRPAGCGQPCGCARERADSRQ